jgi:hypothetical protein
VGGRAYAIQLRGDLKRSCLAPHERSGGGDDEGTHHEQRVGSV